MDASLARTTSTPFVKLGTEKVGRQSFNSFHSRVTNGDDNSENIFKWNQRKCAGNALHIAVVNDMEDDVRELLGNDSSLINSRFYYSVERHKTKSKGSAEAIHIAASRGKLSMVTLLLELKSDPNATVKLDNEYHYTVIHAAVYAEGFGGSVEMVSFLLDSKAEPKPNKDGMTPVHLAYQTSSMDLINYLQEAVFSPAEEENSKTDPPLKMAITRKKMKKTQLAEVAPLNFQSLQLFIHFEPGCVYYFLDRARAAGVTVEDLGMLLTTDDVLRVLRDSKQSADKLLALFCVQAQAEDPGHHPLPSRMSFKETDWFRAIRLLNPPRTLASAYKPDKTWAFDSEHFRAPEWHKQLVQQQDPPFPDVDIHVSVTPNLICPEFFGALKTKSATSIKGSDDILIYENLTVKTAILEVWWYGAYRVEFAQFLLTLTGLIALVHEAQFLEESVEQHTDDGGGCSVAVAFVGSRAWVELLHKFAQFLGVGQRKDLFGYFAVRDASELTSCLIQLLFSQWPGNRWLHVLVILIYWVRMLEVNFAANLIRELLPILRLGQDLVPSVIISFTFFAAFTHILYVLEDNDLSSTIYNSFSQLIEGSVADRPSPDLLKLLFTYASQLLFTIFLLNVFIGVIGENYSLKKERAYLISMEQRAVKSMEFLFVARCVPGGILTRRRAKIMQVVAISVNLAMQLCGIGSPVIFFMCQLLQLLGAYQDPTCAWARNLRLQLLHESDFYLWSFSPLQEG